MKTLFLGDVCPTTITAPLFSAKNTDTLFTDVKSVFEDKDFCFVNLECALTTSDNDIKKIGPPLKAPEKTADVLKKLGVDCCGLSNNHIFDFGIDGAKDTLKALSNAGIMYTGFGENYEDSRNNFIIDRNGEKICIIAVCEHEYSYALDARMGSRPYDVYDTIADIRQAKNENDRVIVIYHGGKEHCAYPSPRLYKLCHTMAENGADMILCQHSHCIGVYEEYENCHILYGQGNFHFVMEHNDPGWHSALAVEYDTKSNQINFIPIMSDTTHKGIHLASETEKKLILDQLDQRNKKLSNGEWKDEWHNFCESVRTLYVNALSYDYMGGPTIVKGDFISHYLDCEAHTDVLKELFPSYNLTNCK